jgi:integrase
MARQGNGPWFRKGKNAWYATVNGENVSLRVKGRGNRPEAMTAWHRLMAHGPGEGPAPGASARAPTVADVITGFLGNVEGRAAAKTVGVYRYFLGPFSDCHGRGRAADLRPHAVEKYSRKPTWGPSTRHDFIGAVVSAFRWAERAGLIPRNPLNNIRKPPKASRGMKVVLSEGEFGRLCGEASEAFGVFLRGLWLTGCRPGELARLTAADVDHVAGVAVSEAHKTAGKTGRPRIIYLTADAVTLFHSQARKNPTGPIFRNTAGRMWTEDAVVKAMRTARTRAGLPKAVAYGMRHSFATEALSRGVPDAHVAALLGHGSTAMLHKHYSHLGSRADVLREAAKRVRG